jgi:hypothetical protein
MSALTQHFYTSDEVHAALQYASTRNDRIETVFWCHELLRSGYVGETISTLFEAWLWNKGPFCLAWLLDAHTLGSDEVSENSILLAAYQLSTVSYLRNDHSLWDILVLTAMDTPPDRVTPKTPELPSVDEKETFMMRALYQGKAYTAWWISRYLKSERVWELLRWYAVRYCAPSMCACLDILEPYEALLGYRSDEYDVIIRCMAVISVCLSPSQQTTSFAALPASMDERILETIAEWDKECGRITHRRYTIPVRCLYGKTRRGTMKWTTTTVKYLGQLEEGIKECPFWQEAMSEYVTTHGVWKSDDMREAFYDRHFPDDIPDEWSKAEKNKSHGDGVLGPNEPITLAKWSRCFFAGVSRFAWHSKVFLEQHANTLLDVIHLFPPVKPIESAQLQPVHRRKIIA